MLGIVAAKLRNSLLVDKLHRHGRTAVCPMLHDSGHGSYTNGQRRDLDRPFGQHQVKLHFSADRQQLLAVKKHAGLADVDGLRSRPTLIPQWTVAQWCIDMDPCWS